MTDTAEKHSGYEVDYDIPLLVEQPIKEAAQIAIAKATQHPIHFQDLEPFIVTSVTVSVTEYLEIATIGGISDRIGRFVVIITGMSLQDTDDEDVVANHTITVLSGFRCNVTLRFVADVFCAVISSVLVASQLETFSLVVDRSFPVSLLDCIDDPLHLIEDFVDRYVESVKPDADAILDLPSSLPDCDLTNQLDILKIRTCMEHECPDECHTECICSVKDNDIYMSEILDIGSKFISPITSIIMIGSRSVNGPSKPTDKNDHAFASLLKPRSTTDGDIL